MAQSLTWPGAARRAKRGRYAQFCDATAAPDGEHNRRMALLSEAQLDRTETVLGARFPEPYRQAMLRWNGGELNVDGEVWELIPIRDDSSQRRRTKTCEDVLSWTDQFRMWRTWPKGAISIATNGVGDALLFLKDRGRVHPGVYVWWHETGTLEKVAHRFDEVPSV